MIYLHQNVEILIVSFFLSSDVPICPSKNNNTNNDVLLIDGQVGAVTSTRSMLKFDYYKFPFCEPQKIVTSSHNLGQVLLGDSIKSGPLNVRPPEFLSWLVFAKKTVIYQWRRWQSMRRSIVLFCALQMDSRKQSQTS